MVELVYPAGTWLEGHIQRVTKQFYETMIEPWQRVLDALDAALVEGLKAEEDAS